MSGASIGRQYRVTLSPGQLSEAPPPSPSELQLQTEQLTAAVRAGTVPRPGGGFTLSKAATDQLLGQLTFLLQRLAAGKVRGPEVGLLERFGAFFCDAKNAPRTPEGEPLRLDLRLKLLATVAQNAARAVGLVEGGLVRLEGSEQPADFQARATQATECLKDLRPQMPGLGLQSIFDSINSRVHRGIRYLST